MSGTDRPADDVPPTTTAPTDATDPADPREPTTATPPDPNLMRASSVMAAGTVASRALGFARSAVLVAALGSALTNSTFTVANTVPNIIYILLAGGILNAVFVPQLVRAMKDGPERSRAYTDRLLTLAGLILLAITVVATLAAPWVIELYGRRLTPEDAHVATLFAFWCLPQIFFYGLYTMFGQVLTARHSFGPMMWAPVLNNVVAIATGLAFIGLFSTVSDVDPSSLSTGAIVLLGLGTTLGVVLQALVLVPVLRRAGFGFRPRWDFRGVGLGRARDLAKWTLLFVLVNQLAYVVIVNLALRADVDATSELAYGVGYAAYANAYLIFILPHSIITVSIVTGLLPRLSREAADGDLAAVRSSLSEAWRLTGVGVVLAAAALVALGPELTGILYSGTSIQGAHYIGLVAAAFALGLPAFSAQYIALRGFYAFEDTRTPFLLQVAIAATNVLLALAAYALLPLKWRMVGVALAYSITYVGGLALSTAVLSRRTGGLDGHRVVRHYVRLIIAAIPAGLLGWAVAWAVGQGLGDGFMASLVALAAGGLVLLAVYVGVARALHVAELTALLAKLRLGPRG